jgi:osmotically-inducible protein OsmY
MDSDLKRRVELFLQQKGVSSLPRLSIEVEGGHVMLRGTVRSFYERQLCLCCQHVAGVLRVVDELKVDVTPTLQVAATT